MGGVVIEKCGSYSPEKVSGALKRIFDALGGLEKYVKKGTRVVLKPNLVMKKRPEEAATTHPALVSELSKLIAGAGGSVLIVESPGGLYTRGRLDAVYSACGIAEAASESGAELNYNLEETEVENPSGKYLKKVRVLKPIAEADLVINLPKLKTHGQMMYTGAVKNMFGAVAGALKAEYHFRMSEYSKFADALIDIFLSVKPALNIMDAVIGMDGPGPTSGDPREIGLVLAGEDAFELDFTALDIVNADPLDVPVIKQAVARGLCTDTISKIAISGVDLESVRVAGFRMPDVNSMRSITFYESGLLRHLAGTLRPKPVFRHSTCTGCAECARCCPAHVIQMKGGRPYADLGGCIRCFCCQELCPSKAVDIRRNLFMNFLTKSRKM